MSDKLTIRLEGAVLAGRIQSAMKRRGMKLSALHQRVEDEVGKGTRGTSYAAIWNYAHKPPRSPRLEILEAIAQALDEPLKWLLYGEGDPAQTDELASVFEQMLSDEDPAAWDGELREDIRHRAEILVRLGTPVIRATFLNTLRRLLEHRYPDGDYSRQDILTLTEQLSAEVVFGTPARLEIQGTYWGDAEWENRCVAIMHGINLSISSPEARKKFLDET